MTDTSSVTLPEKGFYIHYKHTPDGLPHNYNYEVVGIGRNTEDHTLTVLYRPLYESEWMPPADLQSRPLEMFVENVEVNGTQVPRFKKITDSAIIAELQKISQQMYLY